jgi:hypothetical protein
LNLAQGKYRVRVDGFNIVSGGINTTSYGYNPQIIHINSERFAFPGGGLPGLNFTNNHTSVMADLKGHREFVMDFAGGALELTFYIRQFGTGVTADMNAVTYPYVEQKTATWAQAQFAYFILTLDMEEIKSDFVHGDYSKSAFKP